jgi:Spy/CpxP family protein refolding chaperone
MLKYLKSIFYCKFMALYLFISIINLKKNKSMKKIILSAIAIASLQLAQAQEARKVDAAPKEQQQTATPEQLATRETNRMQKEIQLSEDQRQKVYQAALTKHQAMQSLKQKYTSNNEGFKAEAKPIRQQYKKELSSILTPEQQEKLKQIIEQQKQHKGNAAPAQD